MRKTVWLTAALTVSGFSMAPWLIAADTGDAGNPQHQREPANEDAMVSGARAVIADSTNGAVRENGFGDFVDLFAGPTYNPRKLRQEAMSADQPNAPTPNGDASAIVSAEQRAARHTPTVVAANAPTNEQLQKLNDCINRFRAAFKSKYGEDFDIHDPKTAFADVASEDMDVIDTKAVAARLSTMMQVEDVNAGASMESPSKGVLSTVTGKDLMMASASVRLSLPGHHGVPDATVYLVRDGDSFRFATLHPLDERGLADTLTAALEKVLDAQPDWPADAGSAERIVSQYVLHAVEETQRAQMDASVGINTIRNGETRR